MSQGHTSSPRAEAGRRNYTSSPLKARNDALALAARLRAVRVGDLAAMPLAESTRVTSLADYCLRPQMCDAQMDADREPYLLRQDEFNDGEFTKTPIYDVRVEQCDADAGLLWIDLHAGEALLPHDTLVYWY